MIEQYLSETTPQQVRERYMHLKEHAQSTYFGELDDDVVIIDTETTGVSFSKDELTQIAAARMVRGEITDWFVTFVNPGKPIPEDIAHLTHIYESDVADAPTPREALQKLSLFVGESPLVAHNAQFDKSFCTKHPEGERLAQNIWIDSLDLARIALPKMKSHRLLDLVRAFDAPLSTHRADADVEALSAVFRILLAAVDSMPQTLVTTISQFATVDEWNTVYVFQQLAKQVEETFDLRSHRRLVAVREEGKARSDAAQIVGNNIRELIFPSQSDISEAFSSAGIVGDIYPGFEARDEQVAMAQAVNEALSRSENLAVEAGTGVGKSMAYLIPLALAAKANEITMGVATKTNTLLDQLVNHELPELSQAIDGLKYCNLKGFNHYPCLLKVERLLNQGPQMRVLQDSEIHQAAALAGILSFIEQSEYDDIDNLKIDYRAIPRYQITTNSHECLRRKCPFFGSRCFVHGARQRAESADIVVTNQSLLFCDVATDGGLLPPIRYWVLDEAHSAEDQARHALSPVIDITGLKQLMNRVGNSHPSKNVFASLERKVTIKHSSEQLALIDESEDVWGRAGISSRSDVVDHVLTSNKSDVSRETSLVSEDANVDTLFYVTNKKAQSAGIIVSSAIEEFINQLHELLYYDPVPQGKHYDIVDIWINEEIRNGEIFQKLITVGRSLYEAAEKLSHACTELVTVLEDMKYVAQQQRDIASISIYLRELMSSLQIILFEGSDEYAYSAHLARKKGARGHVDESLGALLMNVGDELCETLYARSHSVIFTSATITVENSFSTFYKAMGLKSSGVDQTKSLQLDSSYDYDSQMKVYVVEDIPEPNNSQYMSELQKALIAIHRASQGATLTLFTNRREMEKAYDEVKEALKIDDLRVVCQKWGVSVKGLRDDFLSDETLSLFALKSFWEGFDAPGSTLRTVVIPKLPFNKPSDPLSCARNAIDPQAWMNYVLPQAVIEVRQAAGRLIRKSTDSGSLVLADKRLLTKGYGKKFLKSLPSKNITIASTEEIVRLLKEERDAATQRETS